MLRIVIFTCLMAAGLAVTLLALALGGGAGWLLILALAILLIGGSLFLPYPRDGD